jgi:hypothetical protein
MTHSASDLEEKALAVEENTNKASTAMAANKVSALDTVESTSKTGAYFGENRQSFSRYVRIVVGVP